MLTLPLPPSLSLTLPRGGDPDRFLRSLVTSPGDVWALSHGSSLHQTDLIQHAIRARGHVEQCYLTAWWLAYRHCEDMIGLLQTGRIRDLQLNLDESMGKRQKEAAELLEHRSVPVEWGNTHAKAIALRWGDGRCLSVLTSQADPSSQTEWWHTSSSPEVYAWLTTALETGDQDRLAPDLELAQQIQRTAYHRPKSAQNVKKLLMSTTVRPPLVAGHTSYLMGGPNIPSISLLAGVAAQFPIPPTVHLSGWWFAQRAVNSLGLLENAGVFQAPEYVASHVLDGVYGDGNAADHFARAIPKARRRFDDVHAKLALLEAPGCSPVLIASTGNWQPSQPRAEIYVVTSSPAACDMARKWLKKR